jgi:hypothetical protein
MAENSFLSTLKFEHLSMKDKESYTLVNREDHRGDLVCMSFSKLADNPTMEQQKFYLTHGSQILGAIKIVYNGYVEEIDLHVFYIGARCTYETELEMPNDFASKGRLLWAYTLNYVFNTGGPNSIIFNSSVKSAKGYHLKMGMTPYNESLFPEEYIPRVVPMDDLGPEKAKQVLSEADILFYKLKDVKDVNYKSIFEILLSLPESETHKKPTAEFGGRKRTRRIRLRRRKSKSKIVL